MHALHAWRIRHWYLSLYVVVLAGVKAAWYIYFGKCSLAVWL